MKNNASDFETKLQAYSKHDRERILTAAAWALEVRQKKETAANPLAEHLGIAAILAELRIDSDTIVAALLKNILTTDEDSSLISLESIKKQFGQGAATLVKEFNQIADFQRTTKTIAEAENIRKMLFAMVTDIRVILFKLAERLNRLRTLEEMPQENRKYIAQECLDIYAPLADKLGISRIKDELEDLSLKTLNRKAFQQIKDLVALKKNDREQFLALAKKLLYEAAAKENAPIEISTRAKHFYSIYQKMRKRNKASSDMYDLFGLRILCESVELCYYLLGIVNKLWVPIDGRFKDYIAHPKGNGYQSLHTTVMAAPKIPGSQESFGAQLLEIQIRTFEMHHIAENGIASHWLYKKGASKEIVRPVDIAIVNRLKDWKEESDSNAGIAAENDQKETSFQEIKHEILKDSILVFTPRGKVIELPVGATPIDFAYAIHSAIGDHCFGAKVDGAIFPLSAELKNTQVVEILTNTLSHPHINWLRVARTSKARSKIRSWLQQNDPSSIMEKKAPVNTNKKDIPRELPKKDVAIIAEVVPETSFFSVTVGNEKNMMIQFAKCCRPVTGDSIIGYVSRGRGIIIHKKDCPNLNSIPDIAVRTVETKWENAGFVLIKRFKIEARPSGNLFSEIESAIHKQGGHLLEGHLDATSGKKITGFFTIQLDNADDLKQVLKNIRRLPAVYSLKSLG
ncbi:GTP pyrophosphokinase [Spirochaetia bacterium]|nr:GTP pyrophosphokinase [Spirochaetia bacterium]